MLGWGYVKDFCISLFQSEQEEKAVRIYYGECLRLLTENSAKTVMIQSGGKVEAPYVTISLQDILDPKPKEERTAEQIIEGIRQKMK
jgi:hypothetical protein